MPSLSPFPLAPYAKTTVAVLIAGLTVAQAAISDGRITADEWVKIALAVLGVVGVYAVPNRVTSPKPASTVPPQPTPGGADHAGT